MARQIVQFEGAILECGNERFGAQMKRDARELIETFVMCGSRHPAFAGQQDLLLDHWNPHSDIHRLTGLRRDIVALVAI